MKPVLWDWMCPICKTVVEDYAATDGQKVKWIWCEFCEKSVEHVKCPGGHPDRSSAAKWRENK